MPLPKDVSQYLCVQGNSLLVLTEGLVGGVKACKTEGFFLRV